MKVLDLFSSPLVSAALFIVISIVLGTTIFDVEVSLIIFSIIFGIYAIAKVHISFRALVRRSVKKSSDIFGLPRWFVVMSSTILLIAIALAYIAFGDHMSAETHPQTDTNLRFMTSNILIAVCMIYAQWIFIRKGLRAYKHKVKSKNLTDTDSHLFTN